MTEVHRYLFRTLKKVITQHGDGAFAEHGANAYLDLDEVVEELAGHDEDETTDAFHAILDDESIEQEDAEGFITSILLHDEDEELGYLRDDPVIKPLL